VFQNVELDFKFPDRKPAFPIDAILILRHKGSDLSLQKPLNQIRLIEHRNSSKITPEGRNTLTQRKSPSIM